MKPTAWLCVLAVCAAACGGGLDVRTGEGDAASGASADASAPDTGDSDGAFVVDSGFVTPDASSTCAASVAEECRQGLACPPFFAAALTECMGSNPGVFTAAPCDGYDVFVENPQSGRTVTYYYDHATGKLVGIRIATSVAPGDVSTCTVGGTSFPDPQSCMFRHCPTLIHGDAGTCSGAPRNLGDPCLEEGLFCGGGCAPTCECVESMTACLPPPPCAPTGQ
jgi:hypothetical protein